MIEGVFRRGHPRVILPLPGHDGEFEVEFIIDTGFGGDLTLPMFLAQQLEARDSGFQIRVQADGTIPRCPCFNFFCEWDEDTDPQYVEVLVTGAAPLMGTTLLSGRLLQVEMSENGEVSADYL